MLLFCFNENFKIWDNYRCTRGGKSNAEIYQLPFIQFPPYCKQHPMKQEQQYYQWDSDTAQSTHRTFPSPIGPSHCSSIPTSSLLAQTVKNLPTVRETWVRSLGWEDCPGEGNLWLPTPVKNSTTEKPGEAPSVGSVQRVGHDWVTFTFFHFFHSPF